MKIALSFLLGALFFDATMSNGEGFKQLNLDEVEAVVLQENAKVSCTVCARACVYSPAWASARAFLEGIASILRVRGSKTSNTSHESAWLARKPECHVPVGVPGSRPHKGHIFLSD